MMSEEEKKQDPQTISEEPVNVLFNTSTIAKKDVWDIDIVGILELLLRILGKSGKKDLRVAGMAALSSSLIYRMKVESIFALHRAAMEKKTPHIRNDVDIPILGIPYRHEPTYPVTLDELLGLLQNLIGSMANPRERRIKFDPVQEQPDFQEFFINIEKLMEKYEDLLMAKIRPIGSILLSEITVNLEPIDGVRCFFAALFMARDQKVVITQEAEDIRITLET
ncbi:MAG: chromosome segregation protein ScpA [Cenarchaeum symbiont of Oopsacas minuta]|nr:chromosome segregation protein ScpA [Cenarchaeum symbiont of Oopsacas minuta]